MVKRKKKAKRGPGKPKTVNVEIPVVATRKKRRKRRKTRTMSDGIPARGSVKKLRAVAKILDLEIDADDRVALAQLIITGK